MAVVHAVYKQGNDDTPPSLTLTCDKMPTIGVIGCNGVGGQNQVAPLKALAKHARELDFVIHTGDAIYSTKRLKPSGFYIPIPIPEYIRYNLDNAEQLYKEKVEEMYRRHLPGVFVSYALGNHDVAVSTSDHVRKAVSIDAADTGTRLREKLIALSTKQATRVKFRSDDDEELSLPQFFCPAPYYDVHLVGEDGTAYADIFYINSSEYVEDEKQREWLKAALQKSKAKHKIIVSHHPIFDAPGKHATESDAHKYPLKNVHTDDKTKEPLENYMAIFRQALSADVGDDPQIILSAHSHYQHVITGSFRSEVSHLQSILASGGAVGTLSSNTQFLADHASLASGFALFHLGDARVECSYYNYNDVELARLSYAKAGTGYTRTKRQLHCRHQFPNARQMAVKIELGIPYAKFASQATQLLKTYTDSVTLGFTRHKGPAVVEAGKQILAITEDEYSDLSDQRKYYLLIQKLQDGIDYTHTGTSAGMLSYIVHMAARNIEYLNGNALEVPPKPSVLLVPSDAPRALLVDSPPPKGSLDDEEEEEQPASPRASEHHNCIPRVAAKLRSFPQ